MREVRRRRARARGVDGELAVAAPRVARDPLDLEPGVERLAGQKGPHRRVAHEVAVLRHTVHEKDSSPEVRYGPSSRARQEAQPLGDRQEMEARVAAVRGEGRASHPRLRLEGADGAGLGGENLPEVEIERVIPGELLDLSVRQEAPGERRPVPRVAESAENHEQPERKGKRARAPPRASRSRSDFRAPAAVRTPEREPRLPRRRAAPTFPAVPKAEA